jgi:hypothetical protein
MISIAIYSKEDRSKTARRHQMSDIKKTKHTGIVSVNGRYAYVGPVESISKEKPGKWIIGTYNDDKITLIGGYAAGGGRNEWYLNYPLAYGEGAWVRFNSAISALRAIGRV